MMKSTGITRKIDELGRIVIPKELRRTMNIQEGDPLEIFTNGNQIIMQKYEPGCLFCGSCGDVSSYKGKNICKKCLADLKAQVK